jgi:hypothetical protein
MREGHMVRGWQRRTTPSCGRTALPIERRAWTHRPIMWHYSAIVDASVQEMLVSGMVVGNPSWPADRYDRLNSGNGNGPASLRVRRAGRSLAENSELYLLEREHE